MVNNLSLHPDHALETASYFRLAQQVLLVDADLEDQIVAFQRQNIDPFLRQAVLHQIAVENFSQHIIMVALPRRTA